MVDRTMTGIVDFILGATSIAMALRFINDWRKARRTQ